MATNETESNHGHRSPFLLPAWIKWSVSMKMMKCREMFAEFPLDSAAVRRYVPPGYEVRIYPNGKALLLMMEQDCQQCILNGMIRIHPMRMSQLWIEVVGPEEVGPVLPGTTYSLPTQYYYALPHQLDNHLAQTIFSLAGLDIQKVKLISPGGAFDGNRRGKVDEMEEPGTSYSWEESSTLWPAPKIVTGRRRFYREYGNKIKRRSVGLVECSSSFLGEGQVRLEVGARSAIGRLSGERTLIGATNPVEVNICNVKIQVLGG